MLGKDEIAQCLLDSDGTTRDITFTPVSADGLRDFINSLRTAYRVTKASDAGGNDVTALFRTDWGDDTLSTPQGYLHAVFEGPRQVIPVLQVFIDWPMDHHRYGVELSFFPNDLDAISFQLDAVMALVETWRSTLGAEDYFVRYENASWDWYDANGLGVIYTGSQLRATRSS